jgi:hypothetical protein
MKDSFLNEQGVIDYDALAEITSIEFAERVKQSYDFASKFRVNRNKGINAGIKDYDSMITVYIVTPNYNADILNYFKDVGHISHFCICNADITHLYDLGLFDCQVFKGGGWKNKRQGAAGKWRLARENGADSTGGK